MKTTPRPPADQTCPPTDKPPAPPPPDCGAPVTDCVGGNISICCQGDVNIYNGCPPAPCGTTPPETCPSPCPPHGACLPVLPGGKHKMSRDQKLARIADHLRVPSSLAAGVMHAARRFLAGQAPANGLETALFATLAQISRDLLTCTVSAFEAIPPRQRAQLFPPSLDLPPDQPLDETVFTTAVADELQDRVGTQLYGDPAGVEEERPGRIRVYEPQGEDFFSQVRICSINDLRTANYIPLIGEGNYLPSEIQQDCAPQIVDGQPQVVCQVRTTDCPGHSLGSVCARVPGVALGDGVVLQGVNFFSTDAKVRFIDRLTGSPFRDVEAHVWGDIDTPVTEVVNGQTALINDCRVHDRLTFSVPNDLAPAIYEIQVVVPNVTGIAVFGSELVSNVEFIEVQVPPTARFRIVTETIIARAETSPSWLGSDEVGLHTLSTPLFADGTFGLPPQEQKFTDIQDVDFDSGTRRDITRNIFQHDQPILGVALSVLGYEIDSQHAYNQQITSSTDYFIELVKKEAAFIGAALTALGGLSALTPLGAAGIWIAAIAAAVTIGIDIVISLWAPADLIIQDSFGLSVVDLARLTSSNSPAPDPTTFTTEDGIKVNVNATIPPLKLPLEYHETREYVSDDEDSRYEITYRFNRIA